MKFRVYKRILQVLIVLLLALALIYYVSKFFSKDWTVMDNEKKFSTVIFTGIFSWLLYENVLSLKGMNEKNTEENRSND